jgi:hypothetical protein
MHGRHLTIFLYNTSIQSSILYRLRHVLRLYVCLAFQVGDGPRHLEHPRVGPSGEPQPVDGHLEKFLRLLAQRAKLAKLLSRHPGVQSRRVAAEAAPLDIARLLNALAHDLGRLRPVSPCQLPVRQRGHLHVDVDPVQKRPRHLRAVLPYLLGAAAAALPGVV